MSKKSRKELGKTLSHLRRDRNLTKSKFALMIGMDRSYYASIEKGDGNVTFDNLEKIAEGLQVSLSDLFIGVGSQYDNLKGSNQNEASENGWVSL